MRISGWMLLAQQGLSALCLTLSVGRSLGAPMRLSVRIAALSAAAGAAATGALASGSAAVRLSLIPVLCALPALAYPALFPAALRALPGATALTVLTALGWTHLTLGRSLSAPWALMAACMAVLLLPAVLRTPPPPRHAELTIRLGGRRLRADALVDSGNLLHDPLTGLPVIVVSPALLARLTPLPSLDSLAPGMRLLPVRTFSGSATLILIRPERLLLAGRPINALLALSPDPSPHFEALVPASLHPTSQNRRLA